MNDRNSQTHVEEVYIGRVIYVTIAKNKHL